ncbi:MAG: hypothetical protein ACJ749_08580 [Flavisolibacter sp.]
MTQIKFFKIVRTGVAIAVLSFAVACNDTSTSDTNKKDSTNTMAADSSKMHAADTSKNMNKMADTSKRDTSKRGDQPLPPR